MGITGTLSAKQELHRTRVLVRSATARAMTKTGQEVVKTLVLEERRVFKAPISYYALNAFRSTVATSAKPTTVIELKKDPQYTNHPLTPQVLGGSRRTKGFERALATKGVMPQGWYAVPLDAALKGGRVPKGLVQQVLAQAQAQVKASGAFGPVKKGDKKTARRTREAQGRAGGQFVFVVAAKGRLRPGIYLAQGRDFGAALGYGRSGRLVPLFRYVRSVSYQARLDFFGIAERIIGQRLEKNILSALDGKQLIGA